MNICVGNSSPEGFGEAAAMMNDWSSGVEIQNYRIARRIDAQNLADLLAIILCIMMLAGAMTFCVWTRCRIVHLGYETQQLKDVEQVLERLEKNLIAEEETLKNPERIDFIARSELAMEPLSPNQRMARVFGEAEGRPAVLALASTLPPPVPPRKPSSNN
jgi:cell division protein FtsL